MKHYVQIAVLIFACIFSLWIFREHFEEVDIDAKTKEFEQQITTMDAENERLEADIATMNEKIPELEKALKTSEEQIGPAKEQYETKMMQAKANEISNLDKQNADCVDKMPALVEEKTEIDEKIMKVKPMIENLEKEIKDLKAKQALLQLEEEKVKAEYLFWYSTHETLLKQEADTRVKMIKCTAR